eukprot:gene42154-57081_t
MLRIHPSETPEIVDNVSRISVSIGRWEVSAWVYSKNFLRLEQEKTYYSVSAPLAVIMLVLDNALLENAIYAIVAD